jgi:hypothetical protein
MKNAGCNVIFRDCPTKGWTGGHPMGTTDTIFTLVTMLMFAIIVLSATVFRSVNSLSSQSWLLGGFR